jgi:acyl-coenzyme A thioesterase PaaI-like protein
VRALAISVEPVAPDLSRMRAERPLGDDDPSWVGNFVYGPGNFRGLRVPLPSYVALAGPPTATGLPPHVLRTTWRLRSAYCGFHGTGHGGVVVAVLDDTMARAATLLGWWARTRRLSAEFLRATSPGDVLVFEAWVTDRRGSREVVTAGRALLPGGDEAVLTQGVYWRAHGTAGSARPPDP